MCALALARQTLAKATETVDRHMCMIAPIDTIASASAIRDARGRGVSRAVFFDTSDKAVVFPRHILGFEAKFESEYFCMGMQPWDYPNSVTFGDGDETCPVDDRDVPDIAIWIWTANGDLVSLFVGWRRCTARESQAPVLAAFLLAQNFQSASVGSGVALWKAAWAAGSADDRPQVSYS
ncbi:hypothetical protein pkur_cds_424 [Pandoravirus kuranda]|uniref:Uncharacterized protein n=1 Tax=Pandoravirus kuranda TaxID=3019033 RepID=A0AA95EGT7_9VIRU|nr:hypothetical protein pkur_cds_424 [Pandoravirus kuranda]